MKAYRFVYRQLVGLSRWVILAFTMLGLSACGTTGTGLIQTVTAKSATATLAPQSAAMATSTSAATLSVANTWQTYRNERAGYSVDYPATWRIDERTDSDGADMTTFSPPDSNSDGAGLTVIVRNTASTSENIPDMPNTRCQQVKIGKLTGTRCFDTIAFSTTTTFVDQGKTYILASSGKHVDQNTYQRFLSSFTIQS